ncbi:hypothetical protein RAS12_28995 [Achromobacter seleniivolatilans]|uniref:Lipoprotein n=1 Tax=Achromobacter seleniivolatilans TaxID=3047478 RepID=A0ABY9M1T4_9BURK|nr:hypothetical protein [Achromobacter sp. R39]WMD20583.1 hypothetical protein RAS12_28995 [Achromobacter sp. R39]
MTSHRLRGILALIALAVAPSAHAWTRISCDLAGTVLTPPVQMRQYRTDGTELSQTLFKLKVLAADIPDGARADTDCTEFVNREIDVALENTALNQIRKGKPVTLRYRYDESLGQSLATKYELAR